MALGKDENFFDDHFQGDNTLFNSIPYLKDYSPVKTGLDGTKLGFEDDLDVSLITILFQTPIPNLQVETLNGSRDIRISSDENFLVNCGTYMSHITNNYFHAPNHRVTYKNTERFS